MNKMIYNTAFFSLAIAMSGCSLIDKKDSPMSVAEPKSFIHEKHGQQRVDNYFWLKERENPQVINYLKAENERFDKVMAPFQKVQNLLFEEMKSRIIENDETVPDKKGNYWYSRKVIAGAQYPIYLRRLGSAQGAEQVLLNINDLSVGKDFTNCTAPHLDDSQQLMLYACDHAGNRMFTIKGKDLRTGQDLGFEIKDTDSSMVWAADSKNFFYVRQEEKTLRSYQVWRYNILTNKKTLVYEEKDSTFNVSLSKSDAEKYIFMSIGSTLTTEVRFLDRKKPLAAFDVFLPRERGHEYALYDGFDRFYVLTNWNAKDFRLMEVATNRKEKSEWKEIVPQKPGELLQDIFVLQNRIIIGSKSQGLNQISVLNRNNLQMTRLSFPEPSYVVTLYAPLEYQALSFRFEYESMARPETIFEWDLATQKERVLKVKQIPNFNADKYKTERVWITARDGYKLPISILMHKDHTLNGKAPMLVYGYGSYGMSMDPWFSTKILSLVDRGWVFALTHIRGGSELGRVHYENGRQMQKMNTFYDFIDSTESLIKLGYADKKRVYARGGSAGGLLMGAVMNLRPDLYNGIVAQVPFVDVMTTMLDDTLPLTTGEYDEWGNPNEKEAYDYMMRYSPYDNLQAANYPHVLAMTGINDSQVAYWEPAKWIAKMKTLKTNKTLTLLHTDLSVGHGGASGRYESLKDDARWMTFLLKIDRE
jgi:oligopeptidase B